MIFIFFGPPGAGKGTQAKFISNELEIAHLSTGDILRNQLRKNNNLSIKLKTIMDSGQLISDDILNQIILKRLDEKDCKNGFVLDGYPRTMFQAMFINSVFNEKNLILNYIFDFYIDEKTVIKRINNRAALENRSDDSENTIKTRILKYHQETKPVSDYYKNEYNSVYFSINGDQEIENLNAEILNIVKKH